MTGTSEYQRGFDEGYAFAMKQAADLMRETSRREVEPKPRDTAYPLGAVGAWFRAIATRFDEMSRNNPHLPEITGKSI